MNFVVNQAEMLNVLTQITGVLERTQTREVLSHARVVVSEDGELLVSCTDLTMTMVAKLQIDSVAEPGAASIPGLRLFEIFRTIGADESVQIRTVEEMVEITFERSQYTLNVMTGPNSAVLDGFVPSPPEDQVQVEIPAALLRQQLLYTNPVMGAKESRAYMVATCFELSHEYFRTVATEASVLAMATADHPVPEMAEADENPRRFVVPRKTVLQVTSMLGSATAGDKVKLTFGSNHFSAELGVFTLTSNLLNTNYPDYETVFPKDLDWNCTCAREQLRRAVNQVEVVAADSSHRVVLDMKEDILHMESRSTRNDQVTADVPLDNLSGPRQLSMNAEKLLRLLNSLESDKAVFGSSGDDAQANIQITGASASKDGESDSSPSSPIEVVYLLATMSDR